MKKFLSLVVIIACVCMLFSCSGDATSAFEAAIAGVGADTSTTITQVTEDVLGELTATYTVTYNDDGSATINYSYEQWKDITASGTEDKTVITGTITRAEDGTYTDGKDFSGSADSIAAGFSLNLEAVKDAAEISSDKTTLKVNVAAEDTESVFGFEFSYDVELEIKLKGDALDTVTVSYTYVGDDKNEYDCSISCKYE